MEAQVAERTRKLQLQKESMLREVDIKLNHRLDRVLKKLWEVKIKQVLALEREQRISVAKVLQVTEAERGLLNYTNPTANK
ncbi:Hypothetical protein PP7435_CHR3-0077 [Komagataella phaffii CBS 7435]|uniref:Uncharacterized protein n=1 Tax=Komagataella phaffii (strain ATCC 76273 / CBS 7435 / CECT 11047 / NRRL Y-11430 / Wegner 21-1) TaxID=981350 RepID=F2QUH3_KOMPC|nr:Hypothetical protein BQ9382_C3-0476 [Komagataella phaffii CBS 7435]CCA39051.1 Hypothetical protein PP7435_CHR3-0077 [Komagataella phaffii CBS 7435]